MYIEKVLLVYYKNSNITQLPINDTLEFKKVHNKNNLNFNKYSICLDFSDSINLAWKLTKKTFNFDFRMWKKNEEKTLSDFKMNSIDFPLKYIKFEFKKFLLIEY